MSCVTGISKHGMARLAPLFGVGVCGSGRWIWLIAGCVKGFVLPERTQ